MSAVPLRRGRRAVMVSMVCAGTMVATLGLAGCGGDAPPDPDQGTNGVGKLSATEIQNKTRLAAERAAAVRLSGTVRVKGQGYHLDMRLSDRGGTGSVRSKGGTIRLLRIGEELYLKADSSFWTHGSKGSETTPEKAASDRAAAEKLDGKYVKVPDGDPSYQQLSGFADMDLLLDGLITLHGTLEKGERGAAGGIKTIRLTGDQGAGGTLDVSLEGTPYPLRLVRAGGAGTISLSDWNRDVPLKKPAPSEVVDYGRKLPAS
ncbi:hypothetical protein [Streptomyces sp. NPDC059816]|uniref:hypothetical protein n=1 Tax=Streptomyces sp. NPDC059816 TaxID=3346960 RepID=UPI003648F65A